MTDNNASRCLSICPLFESELLLELMFRHWSHPYADDDDYRARLLESVTELLIRASAPECKEIFIQGMRAQDMNFVSAVWYVEFNGAQDDSEQRLARQNWLNVVRRSLPSCFCDTDLLDEPWNKQEN